MPACAVAILQVSALPEANGRQSYTVSVGALPNFTYMSESPLPPEVAKVSIVALPGTTMVKFSEAPVAAARPVLGTPLISTVGVSCPGGGGGSTGGPLTKGVTVTNISATTGNSVTYTLVVPAGATNLTFNTSGGTGDMDMYVKFGSAPTDTTYDCRPYKTGNVENCTFATPQAGTYYVRMKAYSSFSGVSLVGDYSTGGGGGCGGTVLCSGTGVALPSVSTGGVSSNYTLSVPAGKTSVVFTISGGTGDADMYVRIGAAPTTSTYNCRPYNTGNSETCTFTPTTATTYYVNVRAYAAYSGVSLKGTSN